MVCDNDIVEDIIEKLLQQVGETYRGFIRKRSWSSQHGEIYFYKLNRTLVSIDADSNGWVINGSYDFKLHLKEQKISYVFNDKTFFIDIEDGIKHLDQSQLLNQDIDLKNGENVDIDILKQRHKQIYTNIIQPMFFKF